MTKNIKCKKVTPVKLTKKTVRNLWITLFLMLMLSLASQGLVNHEKHHFKVEAIPFSYAIFGLGSCIAIIIISKFLGFLLKRDEDYYKK